MKTESLPHSLTGAQQETAPKVSVIIPTYNSRRFLEHAIRSVLEQTFQDWELILVDDGSTDDTGQMVAGLGDPRIRYVYQQNRGSPAARNTGLKLARGRYVAFLDADDLWFPEKLEKQVAYLDSLPPTIGLVYSDYEMWNPESRARLGPFQVSGRPRGNVLSHLLRPGSFFIHPCASLIRREVFDTVGLFDESLRMFEDWELWVRIAATYQIEALDTVLTLYGQHPNQQTKDVEQMYLYGVEAKLKVLRSHILGPEDRRSLRRYLARHHCSYGRELLRNGKRRQAWKAFLRSSRLQPGARETYLHLGLPLLSPRLYRWFCTLRERLLPSIRRTERLPR
jgi:glycosyltransferase involved in cell wall biosynthesis